jgi:hypothetical protein
MYVSVWSSFTLLFQAKCLTDIVASLRDYADPTYTFLEKLYTEGVEIIREEILAAEEAAALAEEESQNKSNFDQFESIASEESHSDSEEKESEEKEDSSREKREDSTKSSRSRQPPANQRPSPKPTPFPRLNKPMPSRRRTGLAQEVQLSVTSLPPG